MALGIIEDPLDIQLENYSNQLVNNYFADTKEIESADLYAIRKELGMDEEEVLRLCQISYEISSPRMLILF